GFRRADNSGQPLRAAEARYQSEFHFRQAKDGVVSSHAHVARHRQLESASEARTIDGSDDRFVETLDAVQERLAAAGQLRSFVPPFQFIQFLDIASRTKKAAGGGKDDGADRVHRL